MLVAILAQNDQLIAIQRSRIQRLIGEKNRLAREKLQHQRAIEELMLDREI